MTDREHFTRRCGCGATFTTTNPDEADCPEHRYPDSADAGMHLDDPADDAPAAHQTWIRPTDPSN